MLFKCTHYHRSITIYSVLINRTSFVVMTQHSRIMIPSSLFLMLYSPKIEIEIEIEISPTNNELFVNDHYL